MLGTLYVKKPVSESVPDWVDFFVKDLPVGDELKRLKNTSTSAILIKEVDGRQFAIAFGHGRHLLDLSCIEYRFGIKVALNVIEPDSISSIDRQTFDAAPKITKTQTIKPTSLTDYSVNTEQDLLRGVVGSAKPEFKKNFGSIVAGIDSLKLSVITSLETIDELLRNSLARFGSKDYLVSDSERASAFAWVDNLQAVPDPIVKSNLDRQLWEAFEKNDFDGIFMSIPELIEWEEISGFAYTEAQSKDSEKIVNSLDVVEFKSSLRSDSSLETLRNRNIFVVTNESGYVKRFSAYRCLYAEIRLVDDASLYVLTAGNWFKVEPSFEAQINSHFRSIEILKFSPPFVEYNHEGEGGYNDAVALAAGKEYLLLDRKLIQFGGKHSSIEVCDLYKTKPKDESLGKLVHVKRGRDSSSLSHLFAQGLVSSTLLVSEPDFVKEVNSQIAKNGGVMLPSKIIAQNYDVVFAIVDGPAGSVLELPFFSKVNLQNCVRSIKAFGFGVKFLHIPEAAVYLAKKKAENDAKAAIKKATTIKGKGSLAVKAKPVPKARSKP